MFDIGFPELLVVSIVALLILGPERLPEALRTLGLWMGRLRRSFGSIKTELEKELGMDDIRRQLHNESVMEEMQRIEAEVQNSLDADAAASPNSTNSSDSHSDNDVKTASEHGAENSIAPPSRDSSNTTAAGSNKQSTPTDQSADVTDHRVNNS